MDLESLARVPEKFKIMRLLSLLLLCCGLANLAFAQHHDDHNLLTGTITNEKGEALAAATVQWEGSATGVVADMDGRFSIEKQTQTANLIINYVGYAPVTISVEPEEEDLAIEIEGILELVTVEVAAKMHDSYVSTLNTLNVESITSKEFKKAACCNLGESFETNASVDVSYSDAVTGAREIQMLGLRGIYTQLLMENRPTFYGLAAPFALEYIPGTWLEGIQIAKGASSVRNGFQSITGQINTELVKPFSDKPLFVNLFSSNQGRYEANVHLNHVLNEKWSTGLLLHGSAQQSEFDHDDDTFMDMPQKKQLNAMYRLFYESELICGQLNVQGIVDRRESGQLSSLADGNRELYRIGQNNDRVEVFSKVGYKGFAEPYRSLGSMFSATWHRTDSYYGLVQHQGEQRSFFANLLYATIIGTTDHQINYGLQYQYDQYRESLAGSNFDRTESVPGAFADYTFHGESATGKGFGAIVGLRLDHHNLHGLLFTPRANVRYNFDENTVVRASAGRGYRNANIISENVSMLASSRSVVVLENLKMEDAWNYGVNLTHNGKWADRAYSFVVDLYRTDFMNQVVMDMEQDYRFIYFYNLRGRSFSNSALVSLTWEVLKGLNMKVAYKYNDVRTTFVDDGLLERPLTPRHRGLVTADYETPNKKWLFSGQAQWTGTQRLLDHDHLPNEYHRHGEGSAPDYVLANFQVSYRFTKLELYAGGENLTDYRQHRPIIAWQDPFGEFFDATQVYAPTMGARGYLGLRWWIGEK